MTVSACLLARRLLGLFVLLATVANPVAVSTATATSPDETTYARHRFESLANAGRQGQIAAPAVFEFLKRIALNKRREIDSTLLAQVSFDQEEIATGYFASAGVRAQAFRALGFLATPEAQQFLRERTEEEFLSDHLDTLWPVIRIAVCQSQLTPIETDSQRFRFLKSVIHQTHDARSRVQVLYWAATELCDGGALDYLPATRNVFKRLSPSRHADHEQFCQQRMWVITSNPDRIAALRSTLGTDRAETDPDLVNWAIEQLLAIRDSRAQTAVEQFLDTLEAIPADSNHGKFVRRNILLRYRP